ncbi:MAG: hypothetical protein HFJ58_04265 [Clostridia bacterium]|nr:hypothetical protein [Clostridia bacterium]
MKKKKILTIIISISLIGMYIIILAIVLLSKINTYTATITEIYNNEIFVQDDSRLIPYDLCDHTKPESYGHIVNENNMVYFTTKESIYLKDVLILDKRCKKISKSDLSIGDKIYIIVLDIGVGKDVATTPPTLSNVKLIKVLEN